MRTTLRSGLALVFLATGGSKLLDLGSTGLYFEALLPLGPLSGTTFAGGLAFLEVSLAAALLLVPGRPTYLVAGVVIALLLLGSLWLLARGAQGCGCFGTMLAVDPLTTVLKNGLLLTAAVWLYRVPPPPPQ